jgi:hypothetical protein
MLVAAPVTLDPQEPVLQQAALQVVRGFVMVEILCHLLG